MHLLTFSPSYQISHIWTCSNPCCRGMIGILLGLKPSLNLYFASSFCAEHHKEPAVMKWHHEAQGITQTAIVKSLLPTLKNRGFSILGPKKRICLGQKEFLQKELHSCKFDGQIGSQQLQSDKDTCEELVIFLSLCLLFQLPESKPSRVLCLEKSFQNSSWNIKQSSVCTCLLPHSCM